MSPEGEYEKGMRIGLSTILALMWFVVSSFGSPNAEGMALLKAAYPGVQLSQTSPTDWRIWGREFGSGISPCATAEGFIQEFYAPMFGPLPTGFGLIGSYTLMEGKFTVLHFGPGGSPLSTSVLTLLVRNLPHHPLVLVSGNFVGSQGPSRGLQEGPGVSALPAIPYPAHWIEDAQFAIYAEGEEPRLAYQVLVDNREWPHRVRRYIYVDVATGEVLGERNLVYHVDLPGSVIGWATPGLLPDSYDNLPELRVLPGVGVLGGDKRTWTGYDGSFLLNDVGTGPIDVTASVLAGKWARVQTWIGASEVQTLTAMPPSPVVFELNPFQTQYGTAQINGLLHVTLAHDFVKSYAPNFPGIDIPITVNVNLSGPCSDTDYSYVDQSLNFKRASSGCINTCYSTVIYHEYGHFCVDMANPNAKRDYHEGMADVLSAFLTNDPRLFLDFFGPGTGAVRNLETATERYPSKAEEHTAGQVIAGAFWKAKQHLAQRIGDAEALEVFRALWANSLLLRQPAVSPMVVIDLLVLDDDDTAVTNGTPHWESIRSGFAEHNLNAPDLPLVNFDVTLPPQFDLPDAPHSATVVVTPGLSDPDMNTLALNLSVNGSTFVRIPLDMVNPVEVPFPPQACGSVAKWYLSVDTVAGLPAYWPAGGPLAPALTVYSQDTRTVLYDDFESDLGWTVDSIDLTTGQWERGAPWPTYYYDGSLAQPDGDFPYDEGTMCYVTGLGNAGDSPGANDVDGGPTILTSPRFDLSGADGVISFATWLFNEDNDDYLTVKLSADDGQTWVTVRQFLSGDYLPAGGSERKWMQTVFVASEYVSPSNQMRLRFEVADNPNNSVTEAAVDAVKVVRFECLSDEVTFTARVEPTAYYGPLINVTATIEFRDPASGLVIRAESGRLTADGTLSVHVPPGNYDIALKGDRWLREIVPGVLVIDGGDATTFVLSLNGDVDGDNRVGVADLTTVLLAFAQVSDGPVNLDGIGQVDMQDLAIVLGNYGRIGPD
ncbi:MAG: hypothetical protein HRF45_10425 [Fimbriimonadia bacterium]